MQSLTGGLMVNNLFEHIEPAAFGITLGIQVLSNHIHTVPFARLIGELKETLVSNIGFWCSDPVFLPSGCLALSMTQASHAPLSVP